MLIRKTAIPLLISMLFAGIGFAPFEVAAQSEEKIKVTSNVLKSRIAIGEIGTLIIEVTGAEARLPRAIEAEGLEITHSGDQSSIEIVNGVQTLKFTHFYRFRGNEPGTYTIPAFEIVIPSGPRTTRPIPITVFEQDASNALDATRPQFAKLELDRDEFYVNEVVPFEVKAFVRGRNAISDVVQPRFEHESFVTKTFRDVRTEGSELGSTYYSSAILPSFLFALKPGEHRLGPAELGVRVLDSSSGFGFSSFFSRTVMKEMATNTVKVTVKPLPEGAPAGFSGAVGNFEFTVQPSTTEVSVGDPISLEFQVTGVGNLQTMSVPVFQTPQTGKWKSYEASKQIAEGDDGFTQGTVIFSQVILPETEVDTIPSFLFSYFDPVAEEYISKASTPIPIQVSADPNPAGSPAISFPRNNNGAISTPAVSRPEASYEDMLFIRASQPRWISAAALDGESWIHYAIHGFFSICFFTLIGFGIARAARQRKLAGDLTAPPASFAEAMKQIPTTASPRREYYKAVATAISCWESEHRDAPEPVMEVVERVTAKCDQFLYSGRNNQESPISPEEAKEFQSILQKLPRK